MLLSGKGNEQKNVNSGTTRKRIGMDNSINTPTVPGGASPFLTIYVKVSHIRRIPEVTQLTYSSPFFWLVITSYSLQEKICPLTN